MNEGFSNKELERQEVSVDPSLVPPGPAGAWRGVHRALGDPLRIRLFEALWQGPRSAKELSAEVGLPPDRLYYHLRQLQQAGIVEVAEYRPLPGGKVERVYRRVEAEPPGDASSPEEVAAFLGSVLDVTRADITAAFMAKAAGERREVMVAQGPVRLTDEGLAELQRQLQELQARAGSPDPAGTQARVLVALVDLEERPAPSPDPRPHLSGGTR
jgi:DNA-binding transcriptional ArsR family regulator